MENSSKIKKNQENNFIKLTNGQSRFAKGNKIGRMRKQGYTLADLTKAAMEYDKTHDISILKHYINQLLNDNRLLDKFIDRYVPTKTINDLNVKGEVKVNVELQKKWAKLNDKDREKLSKLYFKINEDK